MTTQLHRAVHLPGAVLMGLGSILGTGVFVSIGIAAGIAGPSVIVAVALAAGVAVCNGLSSAQLAASHPVSGGTYEYGYRYLNPLLGFSAGWMFLCAKSASAATAALGFSGYLLSLFDVSSSLARSLLAVAGVLVLTLIVAGGIQRSNRTNAVIVSITLLALIAFVAAGAPIALAAGPRHLTPLFPENGWRDLLHATALMFVAYTGYGRIATLGEEVVDPGRNIPRAIGLTLVLTMVLYVAVAVVGVGAAGAPAFAASTRATAAPLEVVASTFEVPAITGVVAVGAVTAMLGVLLNLVLGLSRVLLAMARRNDAPAALAKIESGGRPRRAVLVMGAAIAALAAIGTVRTTWSFSAFTVLVYYALTNLAALQLPPEARLYPRWVAWLGLVSCLGLAFWVDVWAWATGLLILALGWGWHRWRRSL